MEKNFWILESITREISGSNPEEMIYNLYRGLRAKEIALRENDPKQIYLYMLAHTKEVPAFRGNEKIFYEIYKAVVEMSVEDCLTYLELIYAKQGKYMGVKVPDSLTSIMLNKIEDGYRSVFVPDCDKFGVYLYNTIKENPHIQFYTTCMNESLRAMYELIYKDLNVKFINPNIYRSAFVNEKFDLIICFPVLGGRWLYEGEDFISKDPALIAAQNLLYHISMNGKLCIIMPAKVTFGSGDSQVFRSYINDNYKINEICALPAGVFYPYTSIKTYLFTFSNGFTDDVVLKKIELEKTKNLSNPQLKIEDEKLLFIDEFEALNGWAIDTAFVKQDEEILSYTTAKISKNQIKDVAVVFRGKAVNEKVDCGNVSVINISDITNKGIDYSSLDAFNEEERKVSRYILQEGDVLITSRGTTIKIAVYKEQPGRVCVPSANINVIRTNKLLKGAYLKLFLESSVGMKMLKGLQRGSTIVNINYKDIELLEVPVPPMEKQEKIINDYNEGLSLYIKTIHAAEEAWNKIQADIQKDLY